MRKTDSLPTSSVFVDDGRDLRVLVHDHLGDEIFVGQIRFAEVHMCWKIQWVGSGGRRITVGLTDVADLREAGWCLVMFLGDFW